MDKDKIKVILKTKIEEAFDDVELSDKKDFYIGDETINFMAESALNVLLAVNEIQEYLKKEDIIKEE